MSWVTEHIINPPMFILIGAFIAAAGAFWASLEQAQFERVLRTKSDEIAQLNTKIASAVTGGDSFCYLDLAIGDGTTNTPALMLVHQGEYPVYDVSVRIVDLQKFNVVKKSLTLETMAETQTVLPVGNVSPRQAPVLGKCTLPNTQQQSFNVFISARNGFVTQLIRLQRIKGFWKSATKVTRKIYEENKSVVLLEKVDPEFPRDNTGQVQWE